MLNKKSFTLIELVIVVLIIGVLAVIGMPSYTKAKERVLDKEAKSNLALIQAAEKIYRMEAGHYYPPAGTDSAIASINTNLKLNLPSATSWSYAVTSTNQTTASRLPSGRTWTLAPAADTASCSGSGC